MYTTINRVKNANSVFKQLEYLDDEEAHNGEGPRNIYMTSFGFEPERGRDQVYQEMMSRWETLSSDANKTPAFSLTLSFSKNELDPEDPHSPVTAAYIVEDFMDTAYNGFPYVCYFQKDGEGGMLHGHILISNVHYENGKGLSGKQTCFSYFAEEMDKAVERAGIKVDYGAGKDKTNKTVLRARSYNEEHPDAPKFILADTVKEAVKEAAMSATDEQQFKAELEKRHVTIVRDGTRKQGPKSVRYYTYQYDANKVPAGTEVPSRLKIRSDKLGTDYAPEALGAVFQHNAQKQLQNLTGNPAYSGNVARFLNAGDTPHNSEDREMD